MSVPAGARRLRGWGARLPRAGPAGPAPHRDTLSVLWRWQKDTSRTPVPWDTARVGGWERCASPEVPGMGASGGAGRGSVGSTTTAHRPMAMVGTARHGCCRCASALRSQGVYSMVVAVLTGELNHCCIGLCESICSIRRWKGRGFYLCYLH